MKWILKAIVQKTISYLPLSNKINYFFQKYVTKGVLLSDEYYFSRLKLAKAHIEAYFENAQAIPKSCLELGTGWYPIVPISFFLVGVEKIYSVDISFLTSKDRIKTTIEKFIETRNSGILKNYIAVEEIKWRVLVSILENYETLTLENILNQLQLTYLIEDARALSLPDNSIDLVNSNNTFEHIYPEILIPILKDFKRVLKKGNGVQSHFIDMTDHFAHFDKTINIYNFLKFSPAQWNLIDNNVQPQNRMRIDDYKKIYADLNISIDSENFREGRSEELKTIHLSEPFKSKLLEINAISHCHFISHSFSSNNVANLPMT